MSVSILISSRGRQSMDGVLGFMVADGLIALSQVKTVAVVDDLVPMGMGTRCCLDFVDLLEPNEGICVGDGSSGFFRLLSETRATATYPPRPFRVNAGAIHQYVLLAGDKTAYLADVRAGDRVLVVDDDGQVRLVAVGRVKIEKRELVQVRCRCREVTDDVGTVSMTVQQADSVTLAGPKGAVGVLDLSAGQKLCVVLDTPGRHLGARMKGFVLER